MITDYKLDKSVPIPLYYQLKTIIQTEIDKGSYQPDDIIPTEEELIHIFGVSRTTVRQAISELVQEGQLYRIKSKGTFVAHKKINQDFIIRLEPFNDQIRKQNKTPKTQVLALDIVIPPIQAAQALGLGPNDKAIFLSRQRFADDCPLVVVQTYLPYSRCAFVMDHDFTAESLYNILENENPAYKIRYVKRVMEAAKVSSANAKLLEIKTGDPVLFFTSTGIPRMIFLWNILWPTTVPTVISSRSPLWHKIFSVETGHCFLNINESMLPPLALILKVREKSKTLYTGKSNPLSLLSQVYRVFIFYDPEMNS